MSQDTRLTKEEVEVLQMALEFAVGHWAIYTPKQVAPHLGALGSLHAKLIRMIEEEEHDPSGDVSNVQGM